jgi:hypothetical protein
VQANVVLRSNKTIASKVLTLTHKCHLSPPSIFQELPRVSFNGQTLSSDWRTLELAKWAVLNMENVRTLRIINGHYNLTTVFLSEFFHQNRQPSVKRLWLESCSYAGFPIDALGGLESLRLRRLHMVDSEPQYTLSRAGATRSLLNGVGGFYETTVDLFEEDDRFRTPCEISKQQLEDVNTRALRFLNDKIFENVPDADAYYRQQSSEGLHHSWDVRHGSMLKPIEMIHGSCGSLKCLTLDWVSSTASHRYDFECQADFFDGLSRLTFPNLRAFQLRNAATDHTRLITNIYLLEPPVVNHSLDPTHRSVDSIDLLQFIERHTKLQSLAWPIDRFFSNDRTKSEDDGERVRAIIENLGRTLVSLRVDSYYMSRGEPQTDRAFGANTRDIRTQRRLFISDFAAHMTRLKHLKIEGGIPRDEKRELLRAVHACPLEKLVMIGTTFPVGNTWGADGHDLTEIDEGGLEFSGILESEDAEVIGEATQLSLPEVPANFKFVPEYGWSKDPPLMHTIAMHHASTITELKFCGYNGSPVCHKPLPVTAGLFHHLRYFHNLRTLIMSFWLLTFFEGNWREAEIINYWLDQRNSSSTALVIVPEPQPVVASATEDDTPMIQGEQSGWEIDSDFGLGDGDYGLDNGEDMAVTGSGAVIFLDSAALYDINDQEMADIAGSSRPPRQISHFAVLQPQPGPSEGQMPENGEDPSQSQANSPIWPREPTHPSSADQTSEDAGGLTQLQSVRHASLSAATPQSLEEHADHGDQEFEMIFASISIDASMITAPPQFDDTAEQDSVVEKDLVVEHDLIVEQDPIVEQELAVEQDPVIEQEPAIEQNLSIEQNSVVEQDPATEQTPPNEQNPTTDHGPAPGQNPWEHALQTLYSPRALANGVFTMLEPHLSPQARARKHADGQRGINIRASFMLGVESGDIFDLDMCVDEVGIVEEALKGPREEAERFWEKLERRLWF